MTPETLRELQGLLSALCDGEPSEAERARLEELMSGDEDCRRVYLEYLDMHARLLVHPKLQVARPGIRVWRRPAVAQALRYGLVAATTLAASLLFQTVLWNRQPKSPPVPGGRDLKTAAARVEPALPVYLATLMETLDCVWEGPGEPLRTGSRLPPGGLQLRQGIAWVRCDGGIDLVIEGPSELRLETSTSATIVRGKIVFRADETAAPFDLRTPTSTLVDIGTEYAVSVGPKGEEIHVFDGEVERTPTTPRGETEHLREGQARRYGPSPEASGEPMALDPSAFVRRLSAPRPWAANPEAGLLAYEGFDYHDLNTLAAGEATGGTGWVTPWRLDFVRLLNESDRKLSTLDVSESLVRHDASIPSIGGTFDFTGFTKCYRRLAAPVRLDTDSVYYLSFLFRRHGPPADTVNAVAVLLRTNQELLVGPEDSRARLNIGVGGGFNELFTHLQKVGSRTPLPLSYGETYLLVAKVVASEASADQVFMRVYGPDDPVEREEPNSWSVVGPPLRSDLVFDWVELHINSKRRQTLDEFRLGETWASVTAPWCRAKP